MSTAAFSPFKITCMPGRIASRWRILSPARLLSCLAICWLAAGPVQAQEAAADIAPQTALATDRLMEASGLNKTYAGMVDRLAQGTPDVSKLPEARRERYLAAHEKAVASAFSADKVLAFLRRSLVEEVPPADMDFVSDFYESEFGRALVALENEAQSPETALEIRQSAAGLLADLAEDPQRMQTFLDLMELLGMEESFNTNVRAVGYSALKGMVATGQLPAHVDDDAIYQLLEKGMPERWKAMQANMLASMHFTYKSLPDEDLQTYRDFLADERTLKVYNLVSAAVGVELARQSRAYGAELVKHLAEEPT